MRTPPLPVALLGYIRVSTEGQNLEDRALERQAQLIRDFCKRNAIPLLGIHEDVGSAAKPFNDVRRFGLREATDRARREGAGLIVTEPTRLFRDVAAAQAWVDASDVPVVSVRDGSVIAKDAFLDAVREGEEHVEANRRATCNALQKKATKGQALGSPADKRVANAASVRARADRSNEIVHTIAHILETDPAYRDLSHQALADLLNRRKVLTGWGRAWTASGIRRQRALAEQLLQEQREIDNDQTIPVADVPAADKEVQLTDQEAEEERIARSQPYFGIF